MAELARQDVPFVVESPSLARQLGDGRLYDGHADVRLFFQSGDAAEVAPPGATRIASAPSEGRDGRRARGADRDGAVADAVRRPAWHRSTSSCPCYNEERGPGRRACGRLRAYLEDGFPFRWRIVIADNGSTDGTLEIARGLAAGRDGTAGEGAEDDHGRSPCSTSGRGARASPCARRGCARPRMWSPTPTPTCRPGSRGCSRSSPRWCRATPTWPSGPASARGRSWPEGPKREIISRLYNLLLRVRVRRALPRCAVRVQGDAHRRRPPRAARRAGRRVVLRQRAAAARRAQRAAHPRGARRLGR